MGISLKNVGKSLGNELHNLSAGAQKDVKALEQKAGVVTGITGTYVQDAETFITNNKWWLIGALLIGFLFGVSIVAFA